MIDSLQKAKELEREMYARSDLTDREREMLAALQYLLDRLREINR